MWYPVRNWHPVGRDDEVDKTLEDLRSSLYELKTAPAADKPEENTQNMAVANTSAAGKAAIGEEPAIADVEKHDADEVCEVEMQLPMLSRPTQA